MSTRARTAVSTATGWCAASSTSDVRPPHRARVRDGEGRVRSHTACSTRTGSSVRRGWMTARCSVTGPATRRSPISSPSSTGRTIPARSAACSARSRCATTTAPAARFDAGVMCPSYRVTRDETHLTRGRANTLRLALTGQLGADAMTSDAMAEAMALCVSCKACRRECPTGVDMAKMKIEVVAARADRHGLPWRDTLIAELPRYGPLVSRHTLVGEYAQPHSACPAADANAAWASRRRAVAGLEPHTVPRP